MRARVMLLLPVLLCTGGFVGCDSNRVENREGPTISITPVSELEPPVISEHFTLLPCPARPKSTIDLEGCAEHRILRSDKAINELVRLLLSRLGSRRSAEGFVRAERAWLTYRRAACESWAEVYRGGSVAPLVFAHCVVDKNAAHVKELRAFERDLRPK